MIFIQHRVNSLVQLEQLNPEYGAEIDLRSNSQSGRIHLHHDPFSEGEDFERWIATYAGRGIKGPLILNTKEDGLEKRIMDLCEEYGVRNFFFLDTTIPTLVKWAVINSESRFACRLSAYEPKASTSKFKGKVDWLWVDCFNGISLPIDDAVELAKDFKLCLVSPELHSVPDVDPKFQDWLEIADAICTKKPEYWISHLHSAAGRELS